MQELWPLQISRLLEPQNLPFLDEASEKCFVPG